MEERYVAFLKQKGKADQVVIFAISYIKASFPLIAKANSQRVLSNIVIGCKFSQRACELAFAMSGKEPLGLMAVRNISSNY